jgi:hypothetical protein
MKASELRVGNWYDQFGHHHQASGHIISELEKSPESQIWCKPIPLTEEWLLKFGFEYFKFIVESSCWRLNNLFSIREDFTIHFHNGLIVELKCVHQLQNLYFALTGQELSIQMK